jgi:undecaprenyl-diphosphatase
MYGNSLLLGLLQGLTEFLPVSSSGHLVIAQHLLSMTGPYLLFDIILHAATALVVIFYYRRKITAIFQDLPRQFVAPGKLLPGSRLALLLLIGTGSTGLVYLLLRGPLTDSFTSPRAVGTALIITALILAGSYWAKSKNRQPGPLMACAAGLAQGLAIFPGLSRSGLTIVCLLLMGCKRETAVSFSMLLSLPAICGAILLKTGSGLPNSLLLPSLLIGFLAAILSGFAALYLLIKLTRRGKLYLFAPYCLLAGLLILSFL